MSDNLLRRRLPLGVAERLGYYVYLYCDPETREPFYVGKGKGHRVLAHFSDEADTRKRRKLEELAQRKKEPTIEILAHGLKNEETAFRVETAAIDLLRLEQLTNQVAGRMSSKLGRMGLQELQGYYAARPVEIVHPVLLIRINRLYQHGMSEHALYEATRGIWKVGVRREGVRIALAVYEGVVREVFEIQRWYPAGTTLYETRTFTRKDRKGRWEFVGTKASEELRKKYRVRSVARYFKKGMQSPTVYVGD